MTHVTCTLTAKNRDQLRNPTLGNRVWATFTFFTVHFCLCTMPSRGLFDTADACLYSTTMKAFVNTESIGSNPLLRFVVGLSYDLITQATCFLSSHLDRGVRMVGPLRLQDLPHLPAQRHASAAPAVVRRLSVSSYCLSEALQQIERPKANPQRLSARKDSN